MTDNIAEIYEVEIFATASNARKTYRMLFIGSGLPKAQELHWKEARAIMPHGYEIGNVRFIEAISKPQAFVLYVTEKIP